MSDLGTKGWEIIKEQEGTIFQLKVKADELQRRLDDAASDRLCREENQAHLREQLRLSSERASDYTHQLRIFKDALEFVASEGMDDGDAYSHEDPPSVLIAMMNRARSALASARQAVSTNISENIQSTAQVSSNAEWCAKHVSVATQDEHVHDIRDMGPGRRQVCCLCGQAASNATKEPL